MPIDWIDVTSKYGVAKDHPEVKKIATSYDAAVLKLRKDAEALVAKIEAVPTKLEPPKRIQIDHEDGEFNDLLAKMKVEKKYPPVATAIQAYNKAVSAAGATCNAACVKAAAEKDPAKRGAMEQAAIKAHREAMGKAQKATRDVIAKIQPPKMAIGGHRG